MRCIPTRDAEILALNVWHVGTRSEFERTRDSVSSAIRLMAQR
jgi:hypothetical protein